MGRYLIANRSLTREDATQFCQNHGGYLAVMGECIASNNGKSGELDTETDTVDSIKSLAERGLYSLFQGYHGKVRICTSIHFHP